MLALLLAAALAAPPDAPAGAEAEQDAPGPTSAAPLGVRLVGTFREPFLAPVLSDARTPGPPSVSLGVAFGNNWSVPTTLARDGRSVRVQMDEQLEVLELALAAPFWRRRGGAPRAEARLHAKLLRHRGGFTDFLIESWHRHADFTNFGRERYPLDAVTLVLAEEGGATLVDVRGPEAGFGDVALRARAVLAEGPPGFRAGARWGVSAALAVEVPSGSRRRLFGSGGWDLGASALATFEAFRWLTVHGQAGLVHPARLPGGFPLQPAVLQATFELSLAAEWRGFTLLLEDRFATRAFSGGSDWETVLAEPDLLAHTATYALLRPHNQVAVGLRRGPFTTWFAEDFTPGTAQRNWFYDSNGPDVAAGFTVRRGF